MKLQRTLDFLDAALIGLGAIIGAGIFVIVGAAAGMAGPAVIAAMLIAAFVALITAMNFAALAKAIPKEGAGYAFASRLISPFAGYMSGWLWTVSNIVTGAVLALGFASYAYNWLPGAPIPYIAAGAIALFAAINLAGTKKSATLNNALVIIKVGVLLVFIGAGAMSVKAANFEPFAPNGWEGVMRAAAYIFFAYIGFARIATVAEEVKDPEKNIPRAIFAALGSSALIYILVSIVAIGLVGYAALAGSASPIADAAKSLGSPALLGIVVGGGLVATASVLLTSILGVSRVVFAMSRDGIFPSMFSDIGKKFGTPHWSIIVCSAAMAALVFLDFMRLAALTSFAMLAYYSISNYAALKLPGRSAWKLGLAYAGIISCLALIPFLGWEAILDGGAAAAAGIVYYVAVKPGTGKRPQA